jgi:putative drug exporter of the RND superfamily
MHSGLFYQIGKGIYKYCWPIILLWLIAVICCLPLIPNMMAPFKATGFIDIHSKSAQAEAYLNKELGYNKNRFIILYTSRQNLADNTHLDQIKKSLADLKHFPLQHEIIYPNENKKQIAKDKHAAYAVVLFKHNQSIDSSLLRQFKLSIKTPPHMKVLLGGEPFFVQAVNEQTQKDLYHADFIATPASIVTLILVFGSLVAALLPILLGGVCALLILSTLCLIGHAFTLSIFTLNIALLLGLCLSLDYSLFIISRYREELRHHGNTPEAIAITLATAGKAVFFSGLAVFISLSALLFFPINILFSVGVGGLAAVFMAVSIAVILLPAVLSVLNTHIDFLTIKLFKHASARGRDGWKWIASNVVKHPLFYFCCILIILLSLGYPFLSVKFGLSDFHILPQHSDSRAFFDTYEKKFNDNELTPIYLIVSTHKENSLSQHALSRLYDIAHQLKRNPLIDQVNSIVTTDTKLTKNQYYMLYHSSKKETSASIKKLLATTTTSHLSVISIVSKYGTNAPETKKLIDELREINPGKDMSIQITGIPVINEDVLKTVSILFPYTIMWIMALTYLILLVLLRSLFLPFKAIIMNILSLSASYGILVFIFQQGHLHQLLNFDPQGMLDVSLLIIIFCALFGFSMDYEVFLLSRIKEAYEKTRHHERSIILGITQSSGIITSAAMIVIVICCSFIVANVLMVKAFGLGIAVAIFVDAFLIRSILVPATMALVKSINWYLPAWLDRLLPK